MSIVLKVTSIRDLFPSGSFALAAFSLLLTCYLSASRTVQDIVKKYGKKRFLHAGSIILCKAFARDVMKFVTARRTFLTPDCNVLRLLLYLCWYTRSLCDKM